MHGLTFDSLPVSLLILLVFTNRYVLGLFLKRIKPQAFAPALSPAYEPVVEVVTPMFNEGRGIYDTIVSLMQQDYPAAKLRVTVVDDCSTDDSVVWAEKARAEHPRSVTVLCNAENRGKRRSINHAVRESSAEIIVSVDSDVVVDKRAVRALVNGFTRPTIAAVGGRVYVANAHENLLTRMQSIKYFFGYEYLKNIECAFASVMCLSGCLTAYRRSVLMELEPLLESRALLGIPIKYGEDRYLTRQIVKAGYETLLTHEAICWTAAPNTVSAYFAQQLRWRRSNLVDFMGGITHVWHLSPMVAVHYISLSCLLLAYPFVVAAAVYNGDFIELVALHLQILAVMGLVYAFHTRSRASGARVDPFWFLPMAIFMPVTYLLYTPLAMFTLDSSSWETRGHGNVITNPNGCTQS